MAQNTNRGDNQSSGRGFASMDDDKQRDIAAEGGRASHASGKAHEFDSEEARAAGRKGGQASRAGGQSERSSGGGSRSDDRGLSASGQDRDEQGQFTGSGRGSSGGRGDQDR
jgi:hypothetical protein